MTQFLTTPIYVLWLCIVLHLLADYNLQGCLANLKCADWWVNVINTKAKSEACKTANDEKLLFRMRYDWISGLLCHATMWSAITFAPMAYTLSPEAWSAIVIANIMLHLYVDHLKANCWVINLNTDQAIHLAQICGSFILWYYIR